MLLFLGEPVLFVSFALILAFLALFFLDNLKQSFAKEKESLLKSSSSLEEHISAFHKLEQFDVPLEIKQALLKFSAALAKEEVASYIKDNVLGDDSRFKVDSQQFSELVDRLNLNSLISELKENKGNSEKLNAYFDFFQNGLVYSVTKFHHEEAMLHEESFHFNSLKNHFERLLMIILTIIEKASMIVKEIADTPVASCNNSIA